MDKFFVTTAGLGLIAFICWFFFGKSEKSQSVSGQVAVTVSGGYSPSTFSVPAGRPVRLTFTRTDPNSCLEEIVIPDLKIKKYLPLNTAVTLTPTFPRPGQYEIHCAMNMFHGRITAV